MRLVNDEPTTPVFLEDNEVDPPAPPPLASLLCTAVDNVNNLLMMCGEAEPNLRTQVVSNLLMECRNKLVTVVLLMQTD